MTCGIAQKIVCFIVLGPRIILTISKISELESYQCCENENWFK